MPLRIANGAGFLGDSLAAPRRLLETAEVDYLTLEYFAELTMSILAYQRRKNPELGYAGDFLEVLQDIAPLLAAQPNVKVVTNAGGVNPLACAKAAAKLLVQRGLPETSIGVVTGDDLLARLGELQTQGCRFENLDTGGPLPAAVRDKAVCANAYLGARPIAEALAGGARLVITGRVADASLTLGPAVHEFGWPWNVWPRLAAGSVAGHLIECGAQVTGGYSTIWEGRNLAHVGYPIAELESDGSCVITKPKGTGGVVNRHTVAEQLVYEIGDPAHYLTPDVDVDFTTVEITDAGPNRVAVRGAVGKPAPEKYKVSLAWHEGYTATGQLLVSGADCVPKARACGEMIFERLKAVGVVLERTHIELLGAGEGVPRSAVAGLPTVPSAPTNVLAGLPTVPSAPTNVLAGLPTVPSAPTAGLPAPREVMLRVSASDSRREAVERFTKEFAPLITSGPAGLAGYAAGRPSVRPVFAYWPTLVERGFVEAQVQVRSAREWEGS